MTHLSRKSTSISSTEQSRRNAGSTKRVQRHRVTFIKASDSLAEMELVGQRGLRQYQPRNKVSGRETFYTPFTLTEDSLAELIHAPFVPLQQKDTEYVRWAGGIGKSITRRANVNARRCDNPPSGLWWSKSLNKRVPDHSARSLAVITGGEKNCRRKFARCRRGTIILRVIPWIIFREVVVRLAEWCVISFEYFWRVNGIFNSDDYLDRLRG